MLEKKISDMMDSIQDDSVQIRIKNVASTEKIKEAAMNKINERTNSKHHTHKASRILLIAAVTVMVLSVGAFAIYHFGLRDLAGQTVQIGSEKAPTLSLSGLKGTPEYDAAREWENYVQKSYKAGSNELSVNLVWDMYAENQAFSQEAKDKLDSILSKYGLKMHDSRTGVRSFDELYAAAGVSGFMPPSGGNGAYPLGGAFYNDGTFSFNSAAVMPGGADVRYQFYCLAKGAFTRTGYLLADAENYEEWTYTTSNGTDVLLAISANKSIMAVNLDSSFVFVNILSGMENNDGSMSSYDAPPIKKSDLEAFADSFDFAVIGDLAR